MAFAVTRLTNWASLSKSLRKMSRTRPACRMQRSPLHHDCRQAARTGSNGQPVSAGGHSFAECALWMRAAKIVSCSGRYGCGHGPAGGHTRFPSDVEASSGIRHQEQSQIRNDGERIGSDSHRLTGQERAFCAAHAAESSAEANRHICQQGGTSAVRAFARQHRS
jgi:hypothetical protein